MAFQLTQLVPPYHPSLGIPALPNPSNPPTAQDVCDGVEYSHQVLSIYLNKKGILPPQVVADTKRYEVGLITSYDIGQQPALPPAPAGTGPAAANANAPVIPLDGQAVAAALLNSYTQIMATLAQIQADLTDIQRTQSDMQTIQANLQTELTGVQTTQADLQTSQANIQADLNTVRTIQATMRGDLNVVRTLQANMQTTQTGMQTTLTDVRTSQGDMERALANVQATLAVHGATLAEHGTKLGSLTRVCAQSLNRLRGPGTSMTFCIVPFLDDSLPTVPIPNARPALPAIWNVHAIRLMNGSDLSLYIRGYYGPGENVPRTLQARRVLVADAVGCTVGV